MTDKIRGFLRLSFFAVGASFYISRYLLKTVFTSVDIDRGVRLRKEFCQSLIPALGVKIESLGALPKGGGLLVCNHRSYFDPFIILKNLEALPVGKAEVKSWPLIGTAAKVSGAIFIDRSNPASRKAARGEIARAVKAGYFVINYAEGTTHTQAQTIDFKKGMFIDAAQEGLPVYPVAIEYQHETDAWVGDDTFIRHFFACFGKAKTSIKVSYGPKLKAENAEDLLQKSKQWIDDELLQLRAGWHLSAH